MYGCMYALLCSCRNPNSSKANGIRIGARSPRSKQSDKHVRVVGQLIRSNQTRSRKHVFPTDTTYIYVRAVPLYQTPFPTFLQSNWCHHQKAKKTGDLLGFVPEQIRGICGTTATLCGPIWIAQSLWSWGLL